MSGASSSSSRVWIPSNARKAIRNIKEIVGNHSDEEIYAIFKECFMDPDETVQKLLLQDTFQESKRQRHNSEERGGQEEEDDDDKGKSIEVMVSHNICASTKKETFLPLEIISDILSRTPGSSLVRFRRVCKLWNSLTYDNCFIKLHLDRASKVNPPHLIVFSQGEEQGQQKYHLSLLDDTRNALQEKTDTWKTKYRLTRSSDVILTTPPCDGLICLYDYHRNIKLCNPTTQEFLSLPKPTLDSRRVVNGFPKCSFGFHPSTKKYKVVRFIYLQMNHSIHTYNLGCEIFTLGSDSWRRIGNIYRYITGSGINVDGSIYWTAGTTRYFHEEIISLDLKDEKFSMVIPPFIADNEIEVNESMFLAQLEGNLCLVTASRGASGSMDIWMLKDFTNNLWIHKWHVPLEGNLEDRRLQPDPILIDQEKILFRWGANLYYQDLHGKQETVKKVCNNEFLGRTSKFYAFVESLVPLGGERGYFYV